MSSFIKNLSLVVIFCVSGLYASAQTQSAEQPWFERIKVGGDFRYRHEYVDQENITSSNHNERMRARLNISSKINDEVKTVLQLASGNRAATTTNVTYDSGYTKKGIDIDMAYAEWAAAKSTTVLLGKVKNTLFVPGDSDLLWDADLTFEGVTLNWSCNCDTLGYFANLGTYWYEERDHEATGNSHSDTYQYTSQLGAKWVQDEKTLTMGVGYHVFSPIQDQQLSATSGTDGRGNTTVAVTATDVRYAYNYDVAELFATYAMMAFDRPIVLYTNFVLNTATPDENDGHLVGIIFGKLKTKGDWSLGYNYRRLKKDAVLAALTDADITNGETDSLGHKIQARYQLAPAVSTVVTYFKSEYDLGANTSSGYERAQIDFNFSL